MAFDRTKISKVSNLLNLPNPEGVTPGLFHYTTPDAIGTVIGANYFNPYAKFLSVNSVIMVLGANGFEELIVTAISVAGVVTVASKGMVSGTSGGFKVARGQVVTVTAADTVNTGLAVVHAVIATLDSDPVDDPFMVTATIGDQAGAPAAGSIIIKTWKNTGGTDPTPLAATTFGKKVNYIAFGY